MLFEIFGWAAAALTFLTFFQRTMLQLRLLGILASLCFISWALAYSVYPVLVLHACLLPINIYRLVQIRSMQREALAAVEERVSPLDWLRPYVKPLSFRDGEHVFRQGDAPDRMYYLVSGSVHFEEIDKRAGPGELFGEVAFLTARRARTASARCEGPCEIYAIDGPDLATLALEHPAFNFYIMRVIAERLTGGPVPTEIPREPFRV
jgi:CRP/FNR family transcriptional regulator, cyclic AMP receptor protein